MDGTVEDTVYANDVKIDYPDTLDLYGVNKARESRNFVVAKEWREWAFTNAKISRIVRLVMILGNDYLEEIFRSQVTMSILRPLRYH